jgi:hypothetical protein
VSGFSGSSGSPGMASLEFGSIKQTYFRKTFFTNILNANKDYAVAKNFKTGTLIACKKEITSQ